MSTLTALRQKIKAVQTTKKITHAVRLTSMSFYSQMEKKRKPLDYYSALTDQFFKALVLGRDESSLPLIFSEDPLDQHPLFIIISTNKGLCGGLNSNLFKFIQETLYLDSYQKPTWIAVGQKAINFLKRKETIFSGHYAFEPLCTYGELSSNTIETVTDDILQHIASASPQFSSVTFFYSEFKSIFIQKPCKKKIIPLDKELYSEQNKSPQDELLILLENNRVADFHSEQNQEEIISSAIHRYIRSKILITLFQAVLTEHAARFVAMDTASSNADKILSRLTIQYNKLRQALITKEVCELAAATTPSL